MQTTIKFTDGNIFDTSEAKIGHSILKGHNRETLTITARMSYAEAAVHFVDGAVFTLTDKFGDSYEWHDHGVAGAITDNRDGTITAVMGKNNTAEQDAQDEVAKARETVDTLAGQPISTAEDAAAVRAQIESVYAAANMDSDGRISNRNLAPLWKSGNHKTDEVFCTHAGDGLGSEWEQVWKVYQDYDNSIYPDIAPGQSAWFTFNIPYHGTTSETAMPFVPGQPAHAIYHSGEYMLFTDGIIYKCKLDTTYSPTEQPDAWEAVSP